LMFGSETCGDFTGYDFQRITINGSDKSGLGMVSMDGTVISDVHYKDITMTNVRAAITQKIGTRRRCGNSPGIGRIHDITYENITSSGQSSNNFSATLWGESGSNNKISNVTFTNVNLNVPGGSGSVSTGVPSNDPNDYNPKSIGTRPAYGWYIRNANNIKFVGGSVRFEDSDARPAVIANNSTGVTFDQFVAERGTASTDMLFQTVTGYCVRNGTNTTGGALRVSQTGSTESCGTTPPPTGRFEAEDGLCQGTIDSNHAGFSGTGFCNTTNAVGSAEEWSVPRESAGTVTLAVRFANGTTETRPMDLTVNGTSVGTLTFAGTGAWTTWQTATVQVPLTAGTNTVRLAATTAGGGPNVDYVEVA
jgi:Carbohydrate binding module (family 6)/Glycosyl hydrolases family 28